MRLRGIGIIDDHKPVLAALRISAVQRVERAAATRHCAFIARHQIADSAESRSVFARRTCRIERTLPIERRRDFRERQRVAVRRLYHIV